MNRKLPALAMVLLLGVACGEASEPPAASDPDAPVTSSPGTDRPGRGGPQRVETSHGLVDVRPTTFDRWKRLDGGRALDLFFWSGVEECYGVDRVEVEYFKKIVSVTIFEGRRPEAEVCIEMAVRKVVRIQLEEPLGGRTVADGGPGG